VWTQLTRINAHLLLLLCRGTTNGQVVGAETYQSINQLIIGQTLSLQEAATKEDLATDIHGEKIVKDHFNIEMIDMGHVLLKKGHV